MSVPSSLKALRPYLQHAKQTQKVDPIISYYCKYYAATIGIGANPSNDSDKQFLFSLLDELEVEKQNIKEQLSQPEYKESYVTQFAIKIFNKADTEDRNGMATKATARTFYAASIFFNTLKQFGELDPDVQEMLKYAKWKAADINTALKEGRKPTPGPAQTEDDIMNEINASLGDTNNGNDLMQIDSNSPQNIPSTSYSAPSIPTNHNINQDYNINNQQIYSSPSYEENHSMNQNTNKMESTSYSSTPENIDRYNFEPTPEYNESVQSTFGQQFFHNQTNNSDNMNTEFSVSESDFPDPPNINHQNTQNYENITMSNNTMNNGIMNNDNTPQNYENITMSNNTMNSNTMNSNTMGNNTMNSNVMNNNTMNSNVMNYDNIMDNNSHLNSNISSVYTPQIQQVSQNNNPQVYTPQIQTNNSNSYQKPPEQYRYTPPVSSPVTQQNMNQQHSQQQFNSPKQYTSQHIDISDTPDMKEAYRYARFTVSALQFEDVPTAILNLKRSLGKLGVNIQ